MANKTSQHILGTSANLLGFCLFVATSLRIKDGEEKTLLDEFTYIIAFLLATSSICSFLSIRTKVATRERWLEDVAEYLFLTSLLGIMAITVIMVTHSWITW
ncbi:hypothetical protein ACAW74_28210 [Fibrella sp. WM1]|uniref:Uncharacterized protein n=1 Tax=Spirosoma sordidisoli TaxID=2502893 RepID=A0A4Q2UIZ2_9BACT|nr:hypothetical protein [Spirosoma sordidisoli]RYC66729.1 hypothetical protein EQG79_28245 [Spirosoma sordidisoli]